MAKKDWFASLRKISPSEMEYYLEEKAAQGQKLLPIGETGLFYFQFEETAAEKCKFVVDKTGLPMELYKDTMLKKGWEYMGTTADFSVWRQSYTEKRPEDFTDYDMRRKHAGRIGLIFGAFGIGCVVLAGMLGYQIYLISPLHNTFNIIKNIIFIVIDLPFIIVSLGLSKKLMDFK